MNSAVRFQLAFVLLCAFLAVVVTPADADSIGPIGPSKGQVVGVAVAVVAVAAAIGVGVYFLARKPRITGCVVSGQNGLELNNDGDQQTYLLTGDSAAIKVGDRIRVSGKKKKDTASGKRDFVVTKLSKDYGPCKALPATP